MYTKALLEIWSALADDDLAGALSLLNASVPHRYTGLYQVVDGVMINKALSDKRGEIAPSFLAEVPYGDSYCQFVIRDGVFGTADASLDARLDGHKYRNDLLAYTGVPVFALDRPEVVIGTLCHFDTAVHPVMDASLELLQRTSRLITERLVSLSIAEPGATRTPRFY